MSFEKRKEKKKKKTKMEGSDEPRGTKKLQVCRFLCGHEALLPFCFIAQCACAAPEPPLTSGFHDIDSTDGNKP